MARVRTSAKAHERRLRNQRTIQLIHNFDGTTTVRLYDGKMLMLPVKPAFTTEAEAAEYMAGVILMYQEMGFAYKLTTVDQRPAADAMIVENADDFCLTCGAEVFDDCLCN